MRIFFGTLIALSLVLSTSLSAQNGNWCGTHHHLQKQLEADPSLNKVLQKQELRAELYGLNKDLENATGGGQRSAVRIIPVVFQIMHAGGAENISKEQCLDALDRLNKDFRKQNHDVSNIPSVWAGTAADIEVEFRLAQKDPNGNCTDGIVRTFTQLTNAANDNIKLLSSWNTRNYLNVWVVKNIDVAGAATGGFTAGYAQWPGTGSSTTDGVVVRHDYLGGIGTAVSPLGGTNGLSRTLTHEVGHWFGLRHIWGDSNCGNDNVSDTPRQSDANIGCPVFPKAGSCSGVGSNGEMFMNYMDYTNGNCQNMFTQGQKTRMYSFLNSVRSNLFKSSNLAATGTNGTPAVPCEPVAEFSASKRMICEGGSITFTDESWNGDPTSWNWTFTGGTPAASTGFRPVISYGSPGKYPVSLTVSNSGGSNSTSKTAYITVHPKDAKYDAPHPEPVDNASQVAADWIYMNNDNHSAFKWLRVTNTSYEGSACFKMNNFGNNAGQVDELISPSIDLTTVTNPKLFFRLAHAQRSADTQDQLKVQISFTCGQSWITRWSKKGEALSTVGIRSSRYTPFNKNEWVEHSVNLGPYTDRENIRIRFEFISDDGNNLYIDNINLDGIVGIDDESILTENDLSVYPNPFNTSLNIEFYAPDNTTQLEVIDILGKVVWSSNQTVDKGQRRLNLSREEFNGNGVYFVRLRTDQGILTRRVLLTE